MKNLVLLMMAFFALSFTACSDDDDDTLAQVVSGEYVGDLSVEFAGTTTPYTNKIVAVTATADNKVTLSIKDFKFGTLEIGDVLIKNITVTEESEDGDKWMELAGTDKVSLDITGTGNPVALDIKVEEGYYEGNEFFLYLSIDLGNNSKVYVEFDGKRK